MQRSLIECQKLIPGYDIVATAEDGEYFDEEAGQLAIDFIEGCCHHTKGVWRGKPLKLEDWQKGFVSAIFGWKNATGMRRFETVMLYIPRKNGKTILASGLGLLAFVSEPGSEVYVAASTRDQSSICWTMARQMIELEEELSKRIKVYTALKSFEMKDGSIFKPVASDGDALHGHNPSVNIFDELHTFSPTKGRDLIEALTTGQAARIEPLNIYLTTADTEREGSILSARAAFQLSRGMGNPWAVWEL